MYGFSLKFEDHRHIFKRAVRYARHAIKDPERLAFCRSREHDDINAYNLAISDLMHKPVISSVNIRKARKNKEYLVRVRATDNFIITGVKICLVFFDGSRQIAEASRFRKSDLWIQICCGQVDHQLFQRLKEVGNFMKIYWKESSTT